MSIDIDMIIMSEVLIFMINNSYKSANFGNLVIVTLNKNCICFIWLGLSCFLSQSFFASKSLPNTLFPSDHPSSTGLPNCPGGHNYQSWLSSVFSTGPLTCLLQGCVLHMDFLWQKSSYTGELNFVLLNFSICAAKASTEFCTIQRWSFH